VTTQRLLVVQPHHLGDVLVSTPFLAALRRAQPAARVSVLAGSWSAPLLAGNPDVDDVRTLDLPWLDRSRRATWSVALRVAGELRAERFDRVVTLPVSAKTAGFARLCGGRERWGFDPARCSWAWTDGVPYDAHGLMADQYLRMARALGAPEGPAEFRVVPSPEDEAAAKQLLAARGDAAVLAVTAGHPDKQWAPARWAELGDLLAARGLAVLVSAGPSEVALVDTVRRAMTAPSVSVAGALTPLGLAALFRGCRLVVALDSFPMHLAVAVGTPLVALFGPASTPQWRPYPTGRPCRVVDAPPGPSPAAALRAVTAAEVLRAVEDVLA
jgi:ADP-heptose:LPS heptosyltransferase